MVVRAMTVAINEFSCAVDKRMIAKRNILGPALLF
jgi:hypothetical protein